VASAHPCGQRAPRRGVARVLGSRRGGEGAPYCRPYLGRRFPGWERVLASGGWHHGLVCARCLVLVVSSQASSFCTFPSPATGAGAGTQVPLGLGVRTHVCGLTAGATGHRFYRATVTEPSLVVVTVPGSARPLVGAPSCCGGWDSVLPGWILVPGRGLAPGASWR